MKDATEKLIRELFAQHGSHLSHLRSDSNEIKEILKENTLELKEHNGRLRKVEEWKLLKQGGGTVIKGLWGVIGVFVVASIFGMFQMYIAYSKLPETVELTARSILEEKIKNNEIKLQQ